MKPKDDGFWDPTSGLGKLRDEIVETQKARQALLKWKLVVVSTLGAAALGLSNKERQLLLLLALIPPVCVYVDLLCQHLWLRIQVIGRFIAHFKVGTEEPLSRYERFIGQLRNLRSVGPRASVDPKPHGMFDLQDWALGSSTYLASFIVGITVFAATDWTTRSCLLFAGGAGCALTFYRNLLFRRRLEIVWEEAERLVTASTAT